MRSIFVLAVSSMLLVGCSAFAAPRQSVLIHAIPPDAEILVDDRPLGFGSARVELERNHAHLIVVRHLGKQSARVIDHVWSTAGIVDTLGSIVLLFPGIGLLFPGARSLEPRDLTIDVR